MFVYPHCLVFHCKNISYVIFFPGYVDVVDYPHSSPALYVTLIKTLHFAVKFIFRSLYWCILCVFIIFQFQNLFYHSWRIISPPLLPLVFFCCLDDFFVTNLFSIIACTDNYLLWVCWPCLPVCTLGDRGGYSSTLGEVLSYTVTLGGAFLFYGTYFMGIFANM